jgi:hypothetical protein
MLNKINAIKTDQQSGNAGQKNFENPKSTLPGVGRIARHLCLYRGGSPRIPLGLYRRD